MHIGRVMFRYIAFLHTTLHCIRTQEHKNVHHVSLIAFSRRAEASICAASLLARVHVEPVQVSIYLPSRNFNISVTVQFIYGLDFAVQREPWIG